MRSVIVCATMVSATVMAAAATAQPASASHNVFACALGGKSVSVTAAGNQLTYSFGTREHTELRIVASASRGNVFFFSGYYAGLEQQLRFVAGPYSYTVYSAGGNAKTGSHPIAGLVVTKDGKQVADLPCSTYAELDGSFNYGSLPQDTEDHSAM